MEAARQDQTGCCSVLAEAACAQGAGLNAGNETQGRNSALHYACHEGSGGERETELFLCCKAASRLTGVEGGKLVKYRQLGFQAFVMYYRFAVVQTV